MQVIIDDLSIREKATKDSTFEGYTKKGKFTITEVSGDWGKLKSGAGWIYIGEKEWCTILSHIGGTSANKPTANSGKYSGIMLVFLIFAFSTWCMYELFLNR